MDIDDHSEFASATGNVQRSPTFSRAPPVLSSRCEFRRWSESRTNSERPMSRLAIKMHLSITRIVHLQK